MDNHFSPPSLLEEAKSVFGTEKAAQEWLSAPNTEYEGKTPLQIAEASQQGDQRVKDTLFRLNFDMCG